MQPRIVEKTAFTVVGLETKFIHVLSPDATNAVVIGPLWYRFLERVGEVANRAGKEMYGVISRAADTERSHPDELRYLAGVAVSKADGLPAEMLSRTVATGDYAVFTHRGPIQGIRNTVKYIYREWLPQSGYQHAGTTDVELYDERFCLDSPDSEMEYWVPLKPR